MEAGGALAAGPRSPANTCLGGWGFWGHVSAARGVESSTWPWHRIGQGSPQPRVRVYVHIFRRGSLSPQHMSDLVGISIRLITGSGRRCGEYQRDGGLAPSGTGYLGAEARLHVSHLALGEVAPKPRHACERRSGSLKFHTLFLKSLVLVFSWEHRGTGGQSRHPPGQRAATRGDPG